MENNFPFKFIMKTTNTTLNDAKIIEFDTNHDERGFFERIYCAKSFINNNLEFSYDQVSIAQNNSQGTIRGLHYQTEPYGECKLIKCISGSVFDVIVDMRENSDTYRNWFSMTLSSENNKMLYVPRGFAHGYQTLTNDTRLLYFISSEYNPASATGIKWNDPALAINWPIIPITEISDRDNQLPYLNDR